MSNVLHLRSGPIEYRDTGGAGPTLVLCHGLLMDRRVWDQVISMLPSEYRLIAPTLPVGSHRVPMHDDADLSFKGQAGLLAEFVETLALRNVTLVVSDLGYPLSLAANRHPAIERLVVLPCELYTNIPPGLPGKVVGFAAKIPGGLYLAVQSLRVPGFSRLPMTMGRMARHVPRAMLRGWMEGPRASAGVRRDLKKYVRAHDLDHLGVVTEDLMHFTGPTLLIWSREDKVMPFEHAARLASSMANADLRPLDTGAVLLQLDQAALVARNLHEFCS